MINYSDRFRNAGAVQNYESNEYGPGSYSSSIWELEKPFVHSFAERLRQERGGRLRLLDFACGTGRIISHLEPLAAEAHGIDISEGMVSLARKKCSKASLAVGDIVGHPDLLSGPFDLITCFRFVLNVEADVREQALKALRRRIQEPDGRLIVSIHGNSRSLRHPAIVWRRRQAGKLPEAERSQAMLNEMSISEGKAMLLRCGFEVVEIWGFGILPPTLYRTPLKRLAAAFDRSAARRQWFTGAAIDLVLVCRPSGILHKD